MKSKGVKVLDFQVTPEYLVPLLKSMRDVGWYPDAIVLPANFYNESMLEAESALKNVYVNLYAEPFIDAGDLQQESQVDCHACPSGCADGREHRQDDVSDKWRRKQPERRGGRHDDGEQPAAPATPEADPPPEPRALACDSQCLEHKISCGKPVATVRR